MLFNVSKALITMVALVLNYIAKECTYIAIEHIKSAKVVSSFSFSSQLPCLKT